MSTTRIVWQALRVRVRMSYTSAGSLLRRRLFAFPILCLCVSHASANVVYWAESVSGKIQAYDLSTATVHDVIVGLNNPMGVAIDDVAGKVYWTEAVFGTGKVSRANLDGTNIQILATGQSFPADIVLDPVHGKMYWANADTADNRIKRANLDGTAIETFITVSFGPFGLFLDNIADKLYWTVTAGLTPRIERGDIVNC